MLVCSVEDGRSFELDTTLHDIDLRSNLKSFLSELTGIDPISIICFLHDGQQLREDNLQELSGVPNDTIYVFNRDYLFLDTELTEVIHDLERPLFIKTPLASDASPDEILASAEEHVAHITRTLSALSVQQTGLRVAAANLDSHILSLSEVFENFEPFGTKELDRQAELLRNHTLDLEIISRIHVHPEFLNAAVRRDVEAGIKERVLGDYISNAKMKLVADSCARVHEDLGTRFAGVQASMATLTSGADEVRTCLDTQFREEAEHFFPRANQSLAHIRELHSSLHSNSPSSSTVLNELFDLELSIRKDVEDTNDVFNQSSAHLLTVLRQVSFLQSTLAEIPASLTALETELRNKGGFVHLGRLHSMVWVYGATIIEIVRRKEFARFFAERAQTIAEVMGRLTANERKRRQVYRGEVLGQLPFETKGMDEQIPVLEISTVGVELESSYTLDRDDVNLFLDTLAQIERTTASYALQTTVSSPRSPDGPRIGSHGEENALGALAAESHPLREVRSAMEKLIGRMESLSAEFDKLVERSVLSPERVGRSKRRTESDASLYRDTLRDLQQTSAQALQEQRDAYEAQLNQLRAQNSEGEARAARLEAELASVRACTESESSARASLEARHGELLANVEHQAHRLSSALADATQRTKDVDILTRELESARSEAETLRKVQLESDERVAGLLADQAETLRKLEEARSRGEDLEEQIKFARAEGDEAFRALNEATREKDRLLRTQTLEADRLLRDHIAEADGDRAVLEHQFSELQQRHDELERELKEALVELELSRADMAALRDDLTRSENAVDGAQLTADVLKAELVHANAQLDDQARRTTRTDHILADMLEVAVSFRDTNARLFASVQKTLAQASKPSNSRAGSHLAESSASIMMTNPLTQTPFSSDPSRDSDPLTTWTAPVDWSDPAASVEILKQFDLEQFSETILKSGGTIRKWQKQCKEYRERARGKISFRNFAKGDLALFLPTRNSVARPWAAFNVSFPHYFLKPTPQIADQLKEREWIVARITSITERIVDSKDPDSNPYGLGNGVKFYMLEVEDYNQSGTSQRRIISTPHHDSEQMRASISEYAISRSAPQSSPLAIASSKSHPQPGVATSHPQSRAFPTIRSGSSPTKPSALSKLLATSPTFASSAEELDTSRPESPLIGSPPTGAPALVRPATPRSRSTSGHSLIRPNILTRPNPPSPLRPASVKSVASASLSVRPPFAVASGSGASSVKGVPTTALTTVETVDPIGEIVSSPPQISSPLPEPLSSGSSPSPAAFGMDTPSPEGSASEGMTNILLNRSHHHRRGSSVAKMLPGTSASPAGSAWTNLASSWGVSFGRQKGKKGSVSSLGAGSPIVGMDIEGSSALGDANGGSGSAGASVRERKISKASVLLRKFEPPSSTK